MLDQDAERMMPKRFARLTSSVIIARGEKEEVKDGNEVEEVKADSR
jgi:hypothetical protein